MAEFLTTRGITSAIDNIINDAKIYIVLISPFVRIPESLFQNLIAADKRGIRITLIYGKRELDDDALNQLRQLKRLKVRFLENLHSKCYFNEQSMVIASLNLYDFSEQTNREMGVLVTKQDDEKIYGEALQEVQRIYSIAPSQELERKLLERDLERAREIAEIPRESFVDRFLRALEEQGYCIGCGATIDFDEYKPYCLDCYSPRLKNKSQKARYCHECGTEYVTHFYRPLCNSCYDKSRGER